MLKKPLLILLLAGAASLAHAQAPASSPAKKDLVARILKAQQPGIEGLARRLTEEPAMQLLVSAEQALPQRVAKERQQAVAKEIEADLRKYVDETYPIVRDRAIKLAPSTLGVVLEEKFTEDELKQVLAFLESPAISKFQQVSPEMLKSLTDKLVAETQQQVEPKVLSLEQTIGKRLGVAAPPKAPAQGKQPAKK
ncbi:MAG TPA: DUF2059 domain-containing protein [Ramlibacter sp.]|nr:DUF2059 domain-containing protein [Ramlibacter sp.]